MPMPILTSMSQGQCAHGGMVSFLATATKVLIDNAPPLLSGDQAPVAGCAFTVPPSKPQPCVKGVLAMAASKVTVEGKPVMLQGSGDTTQSAEQAPQGPLVYSGVQAKVVAT